MVRGEILSLLWTDWDRTGNIIATAYYRVKCDNKTELNNSNDEFQKMMHLKHHFRHLRKKRALAEPFYSTPARALAQPLLVDNVGSYATNSSMLRLLSTLLL